MNAPQTSPSLWNGNLPKIGIRPTIDGRLGGVRESLEDQTMNLARRVAQLLSENLRYPDGTPVACVISESCIGGVAEASACDELFRRENVGVSLTVTPCWCYGFGDDGHGPDPSQSGLGLQRHRTSRRGVSGRRPGRPHAERAAGVWDLRTRCPGRRRPDDPGGRPAESCSASPAAAWPSP